MKNALLTVLIAFTAFLFAPSTASAQCMGMNPKNCVRLQPQSKGQQRQYSPAKHQARKKMMDARSSSNRNSARWMPAYRRPA